MSVPKRKNNINVYGNKPTFLGEDVTNRRQELLDRITEHDTYLPDSLFHDDLDVGMLDFVKENFKVTSDNKQIPIIPSLLTLQRWGEFTNNWEFSDGDGNVKLPFIAVIRRPDVQFGTNPSLQRTIPNRMTFYYASIPTWNGTQKGADIYKIPQPIAVDISFDVTIVCTKFRDLNKFNKIVLEHFSSRQAYTTVKGHYIPIVLESITDNTPMQTLEGRRFYIQTYKFLMLGYVMDSDEFEVKPAISRAILMTEYLGARNFTRKFTNKGIRITSTTFIADGSKTSYSVGETITNLFYVEINGLLQQRDVNYYHIDGTSRITFSSPPYLNSTITVVYYKGNTLGDELTDAYGKVLQILTESFNYDDILVFNTLNEFDSIIYVSVNGIIQEENVGYVLSGLDEITLLYPAYPSSVVSISYVY